MLLIPFNRLPDCFTVQCGTLTKSALKLTAIHDERLFKLIHHFYRFPRADNEDAANAHHQFAHTAHFRWLANLFKRYSQELSRGECLRVGHMPDLAEGFIAFAKGRQRFPKIVDESIGVWQVYIAYQ